MNELIEDLKKRLIENLNLEISPDEIDPDAPLFGDGLGLDSIDALEMILILEKYYGLRLNDPNEGKQIFRSVRTMARYIIDNEQKQ